jgi:hypothetical protein
MDDTLIAIQCPVLVRRNGRSGLRIQLMTWSASKVVTVEQVTVATLYRGSSQYLPTGAFGMSTYGLGVVSGIRGSSISIG